MIIVSLVAVLSCHSKNYNVAVPLNTCVCHQTLLFSVHACVCLCVCMYCWFFFLCFLFGLPVCTYVFSNKSIRIKSARKDVHSDLHCVVTILYCCQYSSILALFVRLQF